MPAIAIQFPENGDLAAAHAARRGPLNIAPAEAAECLSDDDYGRAVVMAAAIPDHADLDDEAGIFRELAALRFPHRLARLLPHAIAKAREFRASNFRR
jgi:hypothetical protein